MEFKLVFRMWQAWSHFNTMSNYFQVFLDCENGICPFWHESYYNQGMLSKYQRSGWNTFLHVALSNHVFLKFPVKTNKEEKKFSL